VTLERGFGEDTNVRGFQRATGPYTFFLGQGKNTTAVLLDDAPALVIRHKLFVKSDPTAAGMRATCAGMNPHQNPDPCPRECLICNAAIRYKQIGRQLGVHLTLIDEARGTGKGGKIFADSRRLLELDKKGGEIFAAQKKAYGSLVGMRFNIFRSNAPNSSRIGDSWSPLGRIPNLMHHFWQSPAVGMMVEASMQKGGKPITHEEAVRKLITPEDYDKTLGKYDVAEAEAFVAYIAHVNGDGAKSIPVNGFAGQPGAQGYQVPPMPGAPQGQPQNYMAAGAVPTTPYQQPPQQQAPQGYPPQQQQPQGYPPQPQAPQGYAPQSQPQPQYPQAPAQQQYAQPPAPAPGYSAPPFPGQPQAAPGNPAAWEGQQQIPGRPGFDPVAAAMALSPQGAPQGHPQQQPQGAPQGWPQHAPQHQMARGSPAPLPDPRGATPAPGPQYQAPPPNPAYQPFPQGGQPGYGQAPPPMQPQGYGAPQGGPTVPQGPPAQASQGWAPMPPGMQSAAPQGPPPGQSFAFGAPPMMTGAPQGPGSGPPMGQTTGEPPF
jgi:hypothetical protein